MNYINRVNVELICSENLLEKSCSYNESLAFDDPLEKDTQVFDILNNLRLKNVNKLIVGNLNVNSIANKINDLRILVPSKIDILVITETKLWWRDFVIC